MNRLPLSLLAAVIIPNGQLSAGTLVGVRDAGHEFRLCSLSGDECIHSSGQTHVETDSVLDQLPHFYLTSTDRYSYELTSLDPVREKLVINIDLFSGSRPGAYFDTEFSAEIALRLTRPLNVTVTVPGDVVEASPYFDMSYFGRNASYSTDVATRQLIPPTNFQPDFATPDPDDVLDYRHQLHLPAGNYLLGLEMASGISSNNAFLDAHAQIIIDFVVPEPTTLVTLGVLIAALPINGRGRYR